MMGGIWEYLSWYRGRAEPLLRKVIGEEKKRAGKFSSWVEDALGRLEEYCCGGKMVRGGLTVLGYQAAGRRVNKEILKVSVAIELLHNFLLIHDDWIDADELRRGKPTIHCQYEAIAKKRFGRALPRWSGGMAFVLGDATAFLAFRLLGEAKFLPHRKQKAWVELTNFLLNTAWGEIMDITYDYLPSISWEEIVKIRELKTAYYTIVMPLWVGLALGGAKKTQLQAAVEYGVPVGIAFQLQDDILGLFGKAAVLGKSTESDLVQGKKTLLIVKAWELTQGEDYQFLRWAWGRADLKKTQVKRVREIIRDCGALAYCQKLAKKLANKGKGFVNQITPNQQLRQILLDLADWVVEREK